MESGSKPSRPIPEGRNEMIIGFTILAAVVASGLAFWLFIFTTLGLFGVLRTPLLAEPQADEYVSQQPPPTAVFNWLVYGGGGLVFVLSVAGCWWLS